MRDHHQRAAILRQPPLQQGDGLRVDVVGRFIQHQQIDRADQRRRQRDALLLPAGERDAALADDGVVSLGEIADRLVDGRDSGAAAYFAHVGRLTRDANVLADGLGEEERLLQHYAYVLPQMAVLNVVYVHAVYVYFARGAGVKPLQKLHKAGFAAAGGAEYGYCLAGVGCE